MFRTAFVLVALASGVAVAADKELVYVQKTGVITLDGKKLGKGYSGHGEGVNNPAKEKVVDVGPIPFGDWTIGKSRTYKKMENCFDLTPEGHDAHGRKEFMVHGDSKTDPGTASKGCIILSPAIRKTIADSGVTKLRVVKE